MLFEVPQNESLASPSPSFGAIYKVAGGTVHPINHTEVWKPLSCLSMGKALL